MKLKQYDLCVAADKCGFTMMTIFDKDPKAKKLPVMMGNGHQLTLDFTSVFPAKKASRKGLKAPKRSASRGK